MTAVPPPRAISQ